MVRPTRSGSPSIASPASADQRTASNGLGAMVGVGGVDGSLARWNKQRSSRLGKRVLRTPPPLGCVGRGGPGDATTSPGPSYIYASLTKGGLSLGCRPLRPATTPSVRATDRPSCLRPGPVLGARWPYTGSDCAMPYFARVFFIAFYPPRRVVANLRKRMRTGRRWVVS